MGAGKRERDEVQEEGDSSTYETHDGQLTETKPGHVEKNTCASVESGDRGGRG
jgi:NADPH-dependent glutamate synthase beta subunit-like oxidoreductase